MATRPVDFHGALVADLPHGRLETRDHRRLVALPAEWLARLLDRATPAVAGDLGAALGAALEPDARAALGDPGEATPDDVAYALTAALAMRGLGTVAFERWGDALALAWRDAPGESEAWEELAASTAAALLGGLTGLAVHGAPVGRADGELRVLLADETVCAMARERARAGDALGAIIARVSRGGERS